MPEPPDQAPSPDAVEKHLPERGRRRGEPVTLYSCCCCCCCCLHTVGGVIGAALVGSTIPGPEDEDTEVEGLPPSRSMFWSSVLMVVAVTVVVSVVYSGGDPLGGLMFSGGVLILVGPLFLFGGCILMAARIAFSPELRRHPRYWWDLGRIFLYTLVGTVGGIGVMYLMYVGLNAAN